MRDGWLASRRMGRALLVGTGFAVLTLLGVAAAQDDEAAEPEWAIVERSPLAVGANPFAGDRVSPWLDPAQRTQTLVTAVGDVIPHDRLVEGSKRDDGYDFSPSFEDLAPRIAAADLAVANLETPVAGEALRISGYPLFNAPEALPVEMKRLGFDVVTTANNHAMDRRERGALATLAALDRVGLAHAGSASDDTPGAARAWFDLEVGRTALLSYTFSTNGIVVPPSRPWLVNWPIDEAKVLADIADVRAAGADLVLLALHWGVEYESEPRDEQVHLAEVFARGGADAILGGHPHVLQPAEVLTMRNDAGSLRQTLVIYSMGNFLSSQRSTPRDAGIVVEATWIDAPGVARPLLADVTLVPTWVDSTASDAPYKVVEVATARAACDAGSDSDLDRRDCARLAAVALEAEALYPTPEPAPEEEP